MNAILFVALSLLVVILKLTQSKIGKQCERNVAIGRIPYTFD